MMVPASQGWEWLDGIPDEWEAPPEIEVPTPYPEVNLAILLLSCDFLGFEVRAAIGRFVAEEALYSIWFLENVEDAGWSAKKAAFLREIPMEQTRVVYEAWNRLDGVSSIDAPNEELRERRMAASADLASALKKSVETFSKIREEGDAG